MVHKWKIQGFLEKVLWSFPRSPSLAIMQKRKKKKKLLDVRITASWSRKVWD